VHLTRHDISVINGQVNTGDITLNAQENISFDGNSVTGILGLLTETGDGNFGGINLNSQNVFLTNGGQISTLATGFGQSADVNINAKNVVVDGEDPNESLQPSTVRSVANGMGDSGDINIVTDNLTLSNGGGIRADSSGIQGNSGNINITANQISIGGEGSFEGIVSGITTNVETEIASNSGDINLTIGSLSLDNSGQIAAGVFSPGNAGDININATDSVLVDGKNGIFASGISVSAVTEDAGNAGNIKITAPSISLINGGDVRSSSGGTGNAGNLEFTTNNFVLDAGVINTSTSEQGDAGNITISVTDKFFATNQSLISSSVGNAVQDAAVGKVGNINITAKEISLNNTSQIQAGAFSGATAEATGIVSLTATESITFTGELTGIFSNNDSGSFGNASQARLFAPTVTLRNGAAITSNNLGQGNGGIVIIEADNLNLENGTTLSAGTVSNTGGIVTLDIAENLTLRDNNTFPSENNLIEARARQTANGGNVDINAEFVIAFPNQNNDIIANAEQGNGGNIDITTQAIFGLEERRSLPPNQTNDIDASSQFGLQGNFSLNTPDVDPTSGLLQLPASVGDASDQISQNPCERGIGSQFIITGKGGFPANPHETLNSDEVRVGLVEPVGVEKQEDVGAQTLRPQDLRPASVPGEVVPAQGWIFNDKGEVTLTAYDPTGTGKQRSEQNYPNTCPTSFFDNP
jgi:large exoprotein involved in heme utilization and adhesion